MRTLDWIALLDREGIRYDTEGTAVGRDEVNIKCPFCNSPDPNEMLMGINLQSGFWHCWKDDTHAGRRPGYLLKALFYGDTAKLATILGERKTPEMKEVAAQARRLRTLLRGPVSPELPPVETLKQWRPERPHKRITARLQKGPFWEYLRKRDLTPDRLEGAELYAAHLGQMAGRVLFPLYDIEGRRVGITGRTIRTDERLRYFTLPSECPAKLVYAPFECAGGRLLFIVEGPFDALKLAVAARAEGLPVDAVALLGLYLTPLKTRFLADIVKQYDRSVVLLDRGAMGKAARIAKEITATVNISRTPDGVSDPGDFSRKAAVRYIRKILYAA